MAFLIDQLSRIFDVICFLPPTCYIHVSIVCSILSTICTTLLKAVTVHVVVTVSFVACTLFPFQRNLSYMIFSIVTFRLSTTTPTPVYTW